jgi:superfamily II RNA helicase
MDDDVGISRERRGREGRSFSEEWDEDRSRSRRGPRGEGPNGRGRESTQSRPTKYSNFEIEAKMKQLQRARVPRVVEVAEQLVEHQLLPAIWFIFSRKQCDTGVTFLDQVVHSPAPVVNSPVPVVDKPFVTSPCS